MTGVLAQAIAFHLPLKSNSVQVAVGSPPYWGGKRNYAVPVVHWPAVTYAPMVGVPKMTVPPWRGQLGHEPNIDLYVAHMVLICLEVLRVLRPDGAFWLNMDDAYMGSWGNYGARSGRQRARNVEHRTRRGYEEENWSGRPPTSLPGPLPDKNLAGVPWRVAFALQASGWWLRLDPVWGKGRDGEVGESGGYGAAYSESRKDRPCRTHEYVFYLTKRDRTYYNDAGVRVNWENGSHRLRSVWMINAMGAGKVDHTASFPPELPEICIRASTPDRGFCPVCGALWANKDGGASVAQTCTCAPSEPTPCLVLDPFVGSGTTSLVAEQLGRRWVGFDLSPTYLRNASNRLAWAAGADEFGG